MKAFLTTLFFLSTISASAMAAQTLNKMKHARPATKAAPARQVANKARHTVRPQQMTGTVTKSSHRVLQTDRIETITPEMRGLRR